MQCHRLEAAVNGCREVLKRLEQISAIVVAAGLAMVSYWLFFSWAGGGGTENRQRPGRHQAAVRHVPLGDESAPAMGTGPTTGTLGR